VTRPTVDDALAVLTRRFGTLAPDLRDRVAAVLSDRPPYRAALEWAALDAADPLVAARLAVDVDWYWDGQPCAEDDQPFCGRCKPTRLPEYVWMSTGSSDAFHAREDCPALKAGQDAVRRRGGDAAPVHKVAVKVALSERFPCLVCFPSMRGRRG
jgi:hypothetical protein